MKFHSIYQRQLKCHLSLDSTHTVWAIITHSIGPTLNNKLTSPYYVQSTTFVGMISNRFSFKKGEDSNATLVKKVSYD
jgi:hypothetical protein